MHEQPQQAQPGQHDKSLVGKEVLSTPDKLFETWERANLEFPQAGYGIAAEVAREVLSGEYDIKEFSLMYPSTEQLEAIIKKMRAAHGARNITTIPVDREALEKVTLLWTRIRNYILEASARYTNRATGAPPPDMTPLNYFGPPRPNDVSRFFAKILERNLSNRPELRQELVRFFEMVQEVLRQDTTRETERERRDLLNFKKHGKPTKNPFALLTKSGRERVEKQKRPLQLTRQTREKIYDYIVQYGPERNLSATFKNRKDVDSVLVGMAGSP